MSETIQRLYAKEFEELHNQFNDELENLKNTISDKDKIISSQDENFSMYVKNAYNLFKNSGMNDDIY